MTMNNPVPTKRVLSGQDALVARQAILVLFSVVCLNVGATIQVPVWSPPDAVTLGPLPVLIIGAATKAVTAEKIDGVSKVLTAEDLSRANGDAWRLGEW